jgi:hypothetical protein
MTTLKRRVARVHARSSPAARQLIRQFAYSPRCTEIIDRLEAIRGNVFVGDIETALDDLSSASLGRRAPGVAHQKQDRDANR